MKRLILVSIVAVGLLVWLALRRPAPPEHAAGVELPLQTVTPLRPAAPARPIATSMPAPIAAPVAAASPLTDRRRQIFDSPDILATIHRVHDSGTPDEKEWALYLLFACVHVNARGALLPTAGSSEAGQPIDAEGAAKLQILKQRAADELAVRCRGVKALARLDDRQVLQEDLRAAAIANRSTFRQLEALPSSQDDRWNSEQATQITASLYSGDPVLARAAFFALLAAMDPDSPGGQDRSDALRAALGPIYDNVPLSDFERLSACASLGLCGSPWDTAYAGPPPTSEALRLAQKYREAIASRLDARSIMAIR